ncbi:MAG: hypothetical protein IPK13_06820 [Deltaproteobacteria bacterium]|nr:hypothetical protein [Deltaproteobacteria bacterium]
MDAKAEELSSSDELLSIWADATDSEFVRVFQAVLPNLPDAEVECLRALLAETALEALVTLMSLDCSGDVGRVARRMAAWVLDQKSVAQALGLSDEDWSRALQDRIGSYESNALKGREEWCASALRLVSRGAAGAPRAPAEVRYSTSLERALGGISAGEAVCVKVLPSDAVRMQKRFPRCPALGSLRREALRCLRVEYPGGGGFVTVCGPDGALLSLRPDAFVDELRRGGKL